MTSSSSSSVTTSSAATTCSAATTPSANPSYCQQCKEALLKLAHRSVRYGVEEGAMMQISSDWFDTDLSVPLSQQRATFVILKKNGMQRGCIGSVEPSRPLAQDVVRNAFMSALLDERFPPVKECELPRIEIYISILSEPSMIVFESEQDLISKLQAGEDGLFLSYNQHQASFLPLMWKQIPSAADFLLHLKVKAGLSSDFWADDIAVYRFSTQHFGGKESYNEDSEG